MAGVAPARGFTLIELMVTLAILALLLLVAAPLAGDWASGTRTHQGRATLVQAYAQAKALALRNPCGIDDGSVVVTFQAKLQQDGRIALQSKAEGDAVNCSFLKVANGFANADQTARQQMLLPAGVALQLAGQSVTASVTPFVKINSRGMAVGSSSFKLTQGGQQNDEEGTLY